MSISYEKQNRVGWLVLDRPEKLNTLAPGDWESLAQILERMAEDADLRCVVIHGSGRSFCAGADIEGFDFGSDATAIQRLAEVSMAVLRSVADLPIPTIAAVHGHAFGAGCELTMVCDIVIADESAVFALPEAAVGVMPAIGLLRGSDHVALHVLKYLAFTGLSLDAAGAAARGMVNSVVPLGTHLEEAGRIATSIAANAPLAIRSAKRLLNRTTDEQFAQAVAEVTHLFASQDVVEGVRAFRTRTPASFRGR